MTRLQTSKSPGLCDCMEYLGRLFPPLKTYEMHFGFKYLNVNPSLREQKNLLWVPQGERLSELQKNDTE